MIAIGPRISAPSPKPSAIGVSARTVVRVVIRIGRSRIRPPATIASVFAIPSRRSRLMQSTSTIAFFTTMPASMITPMSTMTLTVEPENTSAQTTPIAPSGIVNRIRNGCRSDSNWLAITKYTRKMASPMARARLANERSISSRCPPNRMETPGGRPSPATRLEIARDAPARSAPSRFAEITTAGRWPTRRSSAGPSATSASARARSGTGRVSAAWTIRPSTAAARERSSLLPRTTTSMRRSPSSRRVATTPRSFERSLSEAASTDSPSPASRSAAKRTRISGLPASAVERTSARPGTSATASRMRRALGTRSRRSSEWTSTSIGRRKLNQEGRPNSWRIPGRPARSARIASTTLASAA